MGSVSGPRSSVIKPGASFKNVVQNFAALVSSYLRSNHSNGYLNYYSISEILKFLLLGSV